MLREFDLGLSGPGVWENLLKPANEIRLQNNQYEVAVYGQPSAVEVVVQAIQSASDQITLEIGMGATMEPTPGLLVYLEMGIQRLKPLVEFDVNHIRLRFFSTAGLCMNGEHPHQVNHIQWQQKTLFEAYLAEFYPQLRNYVDTEDICQPLSPPENVNQLVALMKEVVPASVLADLAVCGFNHGGILGQANALKYAACHLMPETFGHHPAKGCRVAIGCQGEHVFNLVRHSMPEPAGASPSLSLVIKGVLSKTAPYLFREGAIGKLSRSRNGYTGPITFREMAEIFRDTSSDDWHWWQNSLLARIKSHFRNHHRWDKIPQILELKYLETIMQQHDQGLQRFVDFCKNQRGKL